MISVGHSVSRSDTCADFGGFSCSTMIVTITANTASEYAHNRSPVLRSSVSPRQPTVFIVQAAWIAQLSGSPPSMRNVVPVRNVLVSAKMTPVAMSSTFPIRPARLLEPIWAK